MKSSRTLGARSTRLAWLALLLLVVSLAAMAADHALGQAEEAAVGNAPATPAADERAAAKRREERREFQSQELMLTKSGTWIFKPGEMPRIQWRDAETIRRLGCDEPLRVRWFDAEMNESPQPNASGRWLAWIEGTAPNGTPLRRSRTFYCLPKQLPTSFAAIRTSKNWLQHQIKSPRPRQTRTVREFSHLEPMQPTSCGSPSRFPPRSPFSPMRPIQR